MASTTGGRAEAHLPREPQHRGGRQIDRRLGLRVGLNVVLTALCCRRPRRVTAAHWTRRMPLSLPESSLRGALDNPTDEHRRRAVERADEVRDLVRQAVDERAAVADRERRSPRIRAEHVGEPARRTAVGRSTGEVVVLRGHHREPVAMRDGVGSLHGKPKPNGSAPTARRPLRALAKVPDQLRFADPRPEGSPARGARGPSKSANPQTS